jgi:hypothetical protein
MNQAEIKRLATILIIVGSLGLTVFIASVVWLLVKKD